MDKRDVWVGVILLITLLFAIVALGPQCQDAKGQTRLEELGLDRAAADTGSAWDRFDTLGRSPALFKSYLCQERRPLVLRAIDSVTVVFAYRRIERYYWIDGQFLYAMKDSVVVADTICHVR